VKRKLPERNYSRTISQFAGFFRNGSKKDRFPNPQTKPDTVKLHQLMPMMDMA
jgi:hypothetical protein